MSGKLRETEDAMTHIFPPRCIFSLGDSADQLINQLAISLMATAANCWKLRVVPVRGQAAGV